MISPSCARQSACPIGRQPERLEPLNVTSGTKFFEAADGNAATRITIPTAIALTGDRWDSAISRFKGSSVQGFTGSGSESSGVQVQEFTGSGSKVREFSSGPELELLELSNLGT